jgi:putative ABC transport system permease protein
VTVRLWDTSRPDLYETIKEDLLKDHNILSASMSDKPPIRTSEVNQATVENDERDGTVTVNQVCFYYVDDDFIDLYDIGIKEGRDFLPDHSTDEGHGVIINETAAEMLGSEAVLGREFSGGGIEKGRIIGVVKDFHYAGLKNEIGPMAFLLNPARAKELSIRIAGTDIESTLDHIRTTLGRHIEGFTFGYEFLDDQYNNLYSSENRMGTVLVTFSFIAITIATIGLLGLISFIAAQKTREISIRKILGASTYSIIGMLVKEFSVLVIVSGLIAIPASYFIMRRWLENFAYRTDISAWSLAISIVMTTSITALAVMLQVVKAARANPIDALKSE